jgi:hypothetical protein
VSFFTQFFGVEDLGKETAVLCPFPHYTATGYEYKENNPSAHLNLSKGTFHCKACNKGFSEPQFIQELCGCSYLDAKRIQNAFESDETITAWQADENVTLKPETLQEINSLGISTAVAEELHLSSLPNAEGPSLKSICFPVFFHGQLMDIRMYNRNQKPKCKSRTGALAGLIIPYDLWKDTPENRVTLVCAGEKDMAVARSNGFNAITFTGGENFPKRVLKLLRNRRVAIVYDNDDAGKVGARELAVSLLPYTTDVKVVTGFHEVCKENKEDITDFFVKYGKTKQDLIKYIEETPLFTPTEADLKKSSPIVTLYEAAQPQNIGKIVQTNIQVVATGDTSYLAPTGVMATKYALSNDPKADTVPVGSHFEWELSENNLQDLLKVIDNSLTEQQIQDNIKHFMHINPKERCISYKYVTRETVFKCQIMDLYETNKNLTEVQFMEFTAYTLGLKLESGQKYCIKYKVVPHPFKGGQLITIIIGATVANDSVSNFRINPKTRDNLNVFRSLEGTVEERMATIINRAKGLIGYDGNDQLIETIDLAYHTPLQFNYGNFKDIRAYLDTFIIGESRVGKSSTAEKFREVYGLGTFASLAGNSATIAGLIGGSNKTTAGFQTRAGVIPQNHKGLIIFEEFGKSNANILKELTDIRSSNEVRIVRVSGTLTLPAVVRMITLTNPKTVGGAIKAIDAYPNGMSVLLDLIDTAEDIARYDMVLVLGDKGSLEINPNWEAPTPFTAEEYQTRVRWVWSRPASHIIISKEVEQFIAERSNELNKNYASHIKIFGTETWKKLSRIAIAVAGYLVSTDDNFEQIIVKNEHVSYAEKILINLYDNPTFKLKEYVQMERRYAETDENAVALLRDLTIKYPSVIQHLEMNSATTRNSLAAVAGLGSDEINKVVNSLVKGYFVRINEHNILPTERYRMTLKQINRDNLSVRRLGEY